MRIYKHVLCEDGLYMAKFFHDICQQLTRQIHDNRLGYISEQLEQSFLILFSAHEHYQQTQQQVEVLVEQAWQELIELTDTKMSLWEPEILSLWHNGVALLEDLTDIIGKLKSLHNN